jgi:hypothetical protein
MTSSLPSLLTSAIATEVGGAQLCAQTIEVVVIQLVPGPKLPSGFVRETVFVPLEFVMPGTARSARPSPLRSPIAMAFDCVPLGMA